MSADPAREAVAKEKQALRARGAAIELPDDQPWPTQGFWAKHLIVADNLRIR